MSAPSASKPSAKGDKAVQPKPFVPNQHYIISADFRAELPTDLSHDKFKTLYEKQEHFVKNGQVKCFTAPQKALMDVVEKHEQFVGTAKGTFAAAKQLRILSENDIDFEKDSGPFMEACKSARDYKVFHGAFSTQIQEINTESLQSILPKLQQLKGLKKGSSFPDLEITEDEINTIANVCLTGKLMSVQMPKPVSTSKDDLDKLGRGVGNIIRTIKSIEQSKDKPILLSPGQVIELYGASDSIASLKAKKDYIEALQEAGLSDEQIKKLTGFSDEQLGKILSNQHKRPAPAEDESGAAEGSLRKLRNSMAESASGNPAAVKDPSGKPSAASRRGDAAFIKRGVFNLEDEQFGDP